MSAQLDATHDPGLRSWVDAANDPATDFPIQNLPFGRFRRADDMDWRIGVAIGDQVLDLKRAGVIQSYDMNMLMRLAREQGCPILMVTHDTRIADLADRVIAMEDGRITTQ